MPDNVNLNAKKILNDFSKTFTNLFKEFPKNATEDFIYDESTLRKISHAADAWAGVTTLLKDQPDILEKDHRNTLNESFKTFNQLMEELPRDGSDEFIYDPMIHKLVLKARETLDKLGI